MERDLKRRGEQTAADIRSLMNEWAVAAMGIVDNLLVKQVLSMNIYGTFIIAATG